MNSRNRDVFIFIFSLAIVSFPLNLVWEYLQCAPFFRHVASEPSFRSMVAAAIGDVAMIISIYFLSALALSSLAWFLEIWSLKVFATVLVLSLLIAGVVESAATNLGRWTYTEMNPVIPGLSISVLPLAQMVLINLISLSISKKIIEHKKQKQWEVP